MMDQGYDILLAVENLQVHFVGDGPVARAVDGVDFQVRRRETVCIVGESGCGKTVTALAVLGLLKQPPASIAETKLSRLGNGYSGPGPQRPRREA